MAMVAKNRIQQAVGIQNARTVEALKVDGVDLQIWQKCFSGQKCSCSLKSDDSLSSTIGDRNNLDDNPFSSATLKDYGWDNDNIENFEDSPQNFDGQEDFREDSISLEDIENYSINSDNSLIYGGDKTPCGICYGTGYKEGYQLFNGKRYVLDFYDNPEVKGFKLVNTYPYSFESDFSSDNYIIWKFKAPTYFKKYLGIRVRNNVSYCKNYDLYISINGTDWEKYSDDLIESRNGIQSTFYIKVVPYNIESAMATKFSITHIEVFYQLGDFIKGDFEPISETENWEFFEALRTTKIELAGDISYIGREDVIGEGKNGLLWKVVSITPHMTSDRQIFKNEIELRMIHPSENLYCLKLINEPFVTLNYRGLEQKQGIQTYNGEKY